MWRKRAARRDCGSYIAVCFLGFGLCVVAYYPGLLSPDFISMQSEARDLSFTDWHSTMMPLLWAALYRLFPGPQGMLALLLAFYWGAVFLLAGAAAQIERRLASAMLITGFMPFTINFAGTLWLDVLTATSWLICVALIFSPRSGAAPVDHSKGRDVDIVLIGACPTQCAVRRRSARPLSVAITATTALGEGRADRPPTAG